MVLVCSQGLFKEKEKRDKFAFRGVHKFSLFLLFSFKLLPKSLSTMTRSEVNLEIYQVMEEHY